MRVATMFALGVAMTVASLDAAAGGGGRHPHRHHHHHRAHIGVFIGAPLLLAPFWARPHYSPPVVVHERVIIREPLVFYDEHGNVVLPEQPTQPPAAAAPTWFLCPDSQTYYPYVQTCASQWQRVAPTPPR